MHRIIRQIAHRFVGVPHGDRDPTRSRRRGRPELEPCEGRSLLGGVAHGIPAAPVAEVARLRRALDVGIALRGMTTPTPRSATVFDVSTVGTGRATRPLGRLAFQARDVTIFTSPTTSAITDGTIAFTTARGDRLTGTYVGADEVVLDKQLFFGEFAVTITGGTGRFRGATGTLFGRAVFNGGAPTPTLPTGGFSAVFYGTLRLRVG